MFFEHPSLIFYSDTLTLIDLLPLIWMRYELVVIILNIDANTMYLKFLYHSYETNNVVNSVYRV